MKFLIALCLLLFGCYEAYDEENNYAFLNIIEVTSSEDALHFVYDYLTYKSDKEIHHQEDYWQSPEESYFLKTGDCEDYAIFFMYLLHEKLNIDSHLILLRGKNDLIRGHALCFAEGKFYDPSINQIVDLDLLLNRFYIYKFIFYREVLLLCAN